MTVQGRGKQIMAVDDGDGKKKWDVVGLLS